MARRKRLHISTAVYHVMLRGNDGQPIFFDDADKCRMCLLMQEGVERFGHLIHSFCFMTNHLHLAIQVRDINISRIVQNLAFRYTAYINRKRNRVGHLFQGRFKSIIVNGDRYLKELIRYIHLNPVRAGLVKLPQYYLWSGHRSYLGLNEIAWLTCNNFLKKFSVSHEKAIKSYETYVLEGIGLDVDLDFHCGRQEGFLADEEFIAEILKEQGEVVEKRGVEMHDLITEVCKRFNVKKEQIQNTCKDRSLSQVRGILAFLVRESNNLTIEDLAHYLNRRASGLSRMAKRFEQTYSTSSSLSNTISELQSWANGWEKM